MANLPSLIVPAAQLTTSPVVYYTVPAGQRVIIRQVHFTSTSGSANSFSIAAGNSGAEVLYTYRKALAALDTYDWNTYLVLTAGQTFQMWETSGASGDIRGAVFGDVVTLG